MADRVRKICDLCEMDGEGGEDGTPAVARYWDVDARGWDVCEKHLRQVKESGLEWEEYEQTR